MVKRIEDKKALLGLTGSHWSGRGSQSESEFNTDPYTPQNSMVESRMDSYVMEFGLPSMNSSDFVTKINQKRQDIYILLHLLLVSLCCFQIRRIPL